MGTSVGAEIRAPRAWRHRSGTRFRSSTFVSPVHVPPMRLDTSACSIPKNPSAGCAACSASWKVGTERKKFRSVKKRESCRTHNLPPQFHGWKSRRSFYSRKHLYPTEDLLQPLLLSRMAARRRRLKDDLGAPRPIGLVAECDVLRIEFDEQGVQVFGGVRGGDVEVFCECEGGGEEGGQGAVRRFEDVLVPANQVSVAAW